MAFTRRSARQIGLLQCFCLCLVVHAESSLRRDEFIFPPESWHNHGSSLVESTRGGLLACWFHGSGERKADDVRIEAARFSSGTRTWSRRFVLADIPGYPDTNPTLFVDPLGKLWLFHPTILAHTWESALLRFFVSGSWGKPGPIKWDREGVLHVTPGPEFDAGVRRALPALRASRAAEDVSPWMQKEIERYVDVFASNSTNLLYNRLGWMTRAHPLAIGRDHWLLPLYHDGFSCSLFAITTNAGLSWAPSAPLIGGGNIQPSVVQRRDGTLLTWMRDNGPPPGRLMQSESHDQGRTWAPVTDSQLPNPGSGAESIRLHDGVWLTVGNDTEDGRHSLAVWLSRDEGRSWSLARHLEKTGPGLGSYSYPSVIETRDRRIHFTYSHEERGLETIRHVECNRAWLEEYPR